MIASSQPDSLDCDGCFAQIAEFAELELASKDIPEALQAVKTHLEQCICCKDEYAALLEALRELSQ
jgi:predicted anti-sigma-YlaC factor YlaD